MIFKRRKADSFREQFPDYPIKEVPFKHKAHNVATALGAGALVVGLAIGLLYVLSKVKIPAPVILNTQAEPQTEEEMFKSLNTDQLHKIGRTCMDNNDPECSKTVFSRILELQPDDWLALRSLAATEASLGRHAEAAALLKTLRERRGSKSQDSSKVQRAEQ